MPAKNGLSELSAKLDTLIALVRILVQSQIEPIKKSLLSTKKRLRIYELSDGSHEMSEIARMVSVSGEYVRQTVNELEGAGLLSVRQAGNRRYPSRVL